RSMVAGMFAVPRQRRSPVPAAGVCWATVLFASIGLSVAAQPWAWRAFAAVALALSAAWWA
ncbi:MAG: hypothetical protein AAF907_09700, partial [Planctomycetota bacterium]